MAPPSTPPLPRGTKTHLQPEENLAQSTPRFPHTPDSSSASKLSDDRNLSAAEQPEIPTELHKSAKKKRTNTLGRNSSEVKKRRKSKSEDQKALVVDHNQIDAEKGERYEIPSSEVPQSSAQQSTTLPGPDQSSPPAASELDTTDSPQKQSSGATANNSKENSASVVEPRGFEKKALIEPIKDPAFPDGESIKSGGDGHTEGPPKMDSHQKQMATAQENSTGSWEMKSHVEEHADIVEKKPKTSNLFLEIYDILETDINERTLELLLKGLRLKYLSIERLGQVKRSYDQPPPVKSGFRINMSNRIEEKFHWDHGYDILRARKRRSDIIGGIQSGSSNPVKNFFPSRSTANDDEPTEIPLWKEGQVTKFDYKPIWDEDLDHVLDGAEYLFCPKKGDKNFNIRFSFEKAFWKEPNLYKELEWYVHASGFFLVARKSASRDFKKWHPRASQSELYRGIELLKDSDIDQQTGKVKPLQGGATPRPRLTQFHWCMTPAADLVADNQGSDVESSQTRSTQCSSSSAGTSPSGLASGDASVASVSKVKPSPGGSTNAMPQSELAHSSPPSDATSQSESASGITSNFNAPQIGSASGGNPTFNTPQADLDPSNHSRAGRDGTNAASPGIGSPNNKAVKKHLYQKSSKEKEEGIAKVSKKNPGKSKGKGY